VHTHAKRHPFLFARIGRGDVENVKNGRITSCRAAKLYKITKAMLFKHDKEFRGVKSHALG
jgi:hypothetical protein